MGGHKNLISRRGIHFIGKGSKDLPGKWKLHNLNHTHITLKLCKIYAYSENISSLSLWICKFTLYIHQCFKWVLRKKLVGLAGSILAVFLLHFNYFVTYCTLHTFYMSDIIHLIQTAYFIHIPYLHFLQCFTRRQCMQWPVTGNWTSNDS